MINLLTHVSISSSEFDLFCTKYSWYPSVKHLKTKKLAKVFFRYVTDGKKIWSQLTVWLPVCCHYLIWHIGLIEPAAFSALTATCFLFLIIKIVPSKNALYLLALDFVFPSSEVDSHKQKDNETKMVHIKFLR